VTELDDMMPTSPEMDKADKWLNGDPIEWHFREILIALGLDADSEHFSQTPARVAKMLRLYRQPIDLKDLVARSFEEADANELIVQTNIPFMGFCAHHIVPFFGRAAIGYLPNKRIVGISKLTRLVYAAGHIAPSTQEAITNSVADALSKSIELDVRGVAVVSTSLHGCMAVRGVEAPSTETTVSAMRGMFLHAPALRSEFMSIVHGRV
jgi:GTP cyclohydrolase I